MEIGKNAELANNQWFRADRHRDKALREAPQDTLPFDAHHINTQRDAVVGAEQGMAIHLAVRRIAPDGHTLCGTHDEHRCILEIDGQIIDGPHLWIELDDGAPAFSPFSIVMAKVVAR